MVKKSVIVFILLFLKSSQYCVKHSQKVTIFFALCRLGSFTHMRSIWGVIWGSIWGHLGVTYPPSRTPPLYERWIKPSVFRFIEMTRVFCMEPSTLSIVFNGQWFSSILGYIIQRGLGKPSNSMCIILQITPPPLTIQKCFSGYVTLNV